MDQVAEQERVEATARLKEIRKLVLGVLGVLEGLGVLGSESGAKQCWRCPPRWPIRAPLLCLRRRLTACLTPSLASPRPPRPPRPTDAAPAVPAAPAALATVATGGELHPLEPGAESEEQGADALRDHQLISACGEKCAAYKGRREQPVRSISRSRPCRLNGSPNCMRTTWFFLAECVLTLKRAHVRPSCCCWLAGTSEWALCLHECRQ